MSTTGRVPAKSKTPSNAMAKPPGAKPKHSKKTATVDTKNPLLKGHEYSGMTYALTNPLISWRDC
jgi:hypothetical protein